MLEKTLSLFSVLSRAYDESNASLKRRNQILYIRNGDTLWGDYWDILKVFKAYFDSEFVYIVNNTDDISKNLFSDGDFEETGAWMLNLCEYSPDAHFSGRNGLLFEENGKCAQGVSVNANSVYFVHFFHTGNIKVEIKDNGGRYWRPPNPYADDFGSWVNTKTRVNLSGIEEWKQGSVFFLTDNMVASVTITFIGEAGTFLDYTRLFKKEAYPTFSLVVVFTGRSTPETMGLAPGTDDPIVARNYSGYKHFSGGTIDADETGEASYFDNSAINEDQEPVLAGGKDDREVTHQPNDGYIEDTPLAPWENDEPGVTVDYKKMSYIEQAHIYGVEGSQQTGIYTELLEVVRAGGIPSYIEILVKELDE
jgi:hypothetical protein